MTDQIKIEAHREAIRAIMSKAVVEAIGTSRGECPDLHPLIWAIETISIMIQFAAMIAVANDLDAGQFAMLAEAMFDLVERNKPKDDEAGSSSRVH